MNGANRDPSRGTCVSGSWTPSDRHIGVTRLEIDLAEQPELASRFNVRQTPMVLLVDVLGPFVLAPEAHPGYRTHRMPYHDPDHGHH